MVAIVQGCTLPGYIATVDARGGRCWRYLKLVRWYKSKFSLSPFNRGSPDVTKNPVCQ